MPRAISARSPIESGHDLRNPGSHSSSSGSHSSIAHGAAMTAVTRSTLSTNGEVNSAISQPASRVAPINNIHPEVDSGTFAPPQRRATANLKLTFPLDHSVGGLDK